jgi:hypothetical protein
MKDFYRFLDQRPSISTRAINRTIPRDKKTPPVVFFKRQRPDSPNNPNGPKLRELHGNYFGNFVEPTKQIIPRERTTMFAGLANPMAADSDREMKHRDARLATLSTKTASDVLFAGEEEVRYPRRGPSISGCPPCLQDTTARVFGDYYREHPQTAIQMERELHRRVELRNQNSRGRGTDLITHEPISTLPPTRPESGGKSRVGSRAIHSASKSGYRREQPSFFQMTGSVNPTALVAGSREKLANKYILEQRGQRMGQVTENISGVRHFRPESVEQAYARELHKQDSFVRSLDGSQRVQDPINNRFHSHTTFSRVFADAYPTHAT